MKKIVTILIIGLLAVAGLFAAGKKEEGTQVASAEPLRIEPLGKYEPAVTVTSVTSTNPTIKFEGDDDMSNNVWTRAYEEELGIRLVYNWITDGSQFANKMNLAIASNDLPDVFIANSTQMKMLYDSDLIADLTEVYEKWATPETKEVFTKDEVGFRSTKVNGRMMGLPQTGSSTEGAPILWIRNDWLENLGLPEPKNMQDVLDVARAFTTEDPDQNGVDDTFGIAMNKDLWGMWADLKGFFNAFHAYPTIWVEDGSGGLAYGGVQPEVRDALLALKEMYGSGQIDKEFGVKDGAKVAEDVASGKAGIQYGLWWNPNYPLNVSKSNDPGADWVAYEPMSIDDKPGLAQYSNAVGSYVVVNADFGHPEAAVKMMNFWYDILVNPTLEKAGKYIVKLPTYDIEYYKYTPFIGWDPYGGIKKYDAINFALRTGDTSDLAWDYQLEYEELNKYVEDNTYETGWYSWAEVGPRGSLGVVKRIAEDRGIFNQFYGVATPAMADKMPALTTMQKEVLTKIILGDPIENFDKFVQDWKKLGGDEITAEVNAWYATTK
jgi:putative aldouronate transport system substrate-binding protein